MFDTFRDESRLKMAEYHSVAKTSKSKTSDLFTGSVRVLSISPGHLGLLVLVQLVFYEGCVSNDRVIARLCSGDTYLFILGSMT